MINLHDLTLVIPAYNRPTYLARQVEYWAGTGVHLCILDGSKEKAPDSLISQLSENMHYEYMPIGFNNRLVHAANIVKTKYVALLGDDELYVKQGLRDCLDLLDADSRLIGCVGRSLFFFERDGEIFGHQVYEKSQDVVDMYGDDLQRLQNSFPNGDPSSAPYLLYGVFRKDAWSTMFSNAYSRHYSSGYVYELALLIIGACLGPTKMVNSLVWLRSGENPAMSSAAVNRKIGTGEWGTSAEFRDEYSDFVTRISTVLVSKGVGTADQVEKCVSEVAEQFFAYSLHKPHRPIAYWHRVLYFAARNTPRWVKILLKRNMTKSLGKVLDYKGIALRDALDEIKHRGIEFNEGEMKDTEKLLVQFHSRLKAS